MKEETQIKCKCGGILCSIRRSRLEEFLGHRVYQCDKCGQQWKFSNSSDEPWKTETPIMFPSGS